MEILDLCKILTQFETLGYGTVLHHLIYAQAAEQGVHGGGPGEGEENNRNLEAEPHTRLRGRPEARGMKAEAFQRHFLKLF